MTFKEKLAQDFPDMDIERAISNSCPCDAGYEMKCDIEHCEECWNRVMPGEELSEPIWESGYNTGLKDAWSVAKDIYKLDDRKPVFGKHEFMEDIFDNFTPQEAIELMKTHQETFKIEVGDVVTNIKEDIQGLVLDFDSADPCVWVITENACVEEWDMCDIAKTTKHVDLEPIINFTKGD